MARESLVTGGAGFVGSHLVERLAAAGDTVSVLDDLSRGRRGWISPAARLFEVDLRDAATVRSAVDDIAPDVVVHLAAQHFIPAVEGAPQLAEEINVGGTRTLLDALVTNPPELVLFASTAAVYPDTAGPISETCEPRPFDLYGRTKLAGERMVAEFADGSGAHVIVARIFNVIGPRETNRHVVPELVDQLRRGATRVQLGNLESRRDYTNVVDVAEALQRLLHASTDIPSTFNVGAGRTVAVRDLVRMCEEVLGRRIDVEVDPERLRTRDRAELMADTTLIRDVTGWHPTRTVESTLAELLTEPGTRYSGIGG